MNSSCLTFNLGCPISSVFFSSPNRTLIAKQLPKTLPFFKNEKKNTPAIEKIEHCTRCTRHPPGHYADASCASSPTTATGHRPRLYISHSSRRRPIYKIFGPQLSSFRSITGVYVPSRWNHCCRSACYLYTATEDSHAISLGALPLFGARILGRRNFEGFKWQVRWYYPLQVHYSALFAVFGRDYGLHELYRAGMRGLDREVFFFLFGAGGDGEYFNVYWIVNCGLSPTSAYSLCFFVFIRNNYSCVYCNIEWDVLCATRLGLAD